MAITDNPQVGDSVSFGLTKSNVTWRAPIEGFYNIYCYGAKGGAGWGAVGVNGQGASGSGVPEDISEQVQPCSQKAPH